MSSWHTQLGFQQYPLDPRSNPELVGVEEIEQQLVAFIEQGNLCLLSGPTGSGKTSMLHRITQDSSLSQFRFIYASADGIKGSQTIDEVFHQHKTVWERLTFAKLRNVVLLLDEAHIATRVMTESIKSKWGEVFDHPIIQSVVICQIESRLGSNFSGSFSDRLGQRVIHMPRLTTVQLKEVLYKRLQAKSENYAELFAKDAMEFLTFNANGSVRQLLEYTDAVFRMFAQFKEENPLLDYTYQITKEHVFNALQMSNLVIKEKQSSQSKYIFKKIEKTKHARDAVEFFEHHGALTSVQLAEKLDVDQKDAQKVIDALKAMDVLMDVDDETFVLTPHMKQELTRA
ncbi:MAG: ATP-binding protein [Candidatus Woesearchaeota archaeon]